MDYGALKVALADPDQVKKAPFTILREIAHHVNQRATHNEGRDLVIRALATMDSFGPSERDILVSLVRSVGLFPYMTGYLNGSDLEDYLAYELHRADGLGGEIVFHSLQAKIFHQLMAGGNVVLSASTSVGKSLVIDALVASGQYRKIVVVVPTLALIDETRRRLLERFRKKCAVVTHPSQRARSDLINIYVLTQERVLHRKDLGDIDLFIVDEFYKMSLAADKEKDRAVDLNLAFHKLVSTGAQFYLLGPNIQSIRGLERYEYHFIPSEFSTVAVDVINYNLPTRGQERDHKLLEICKNIEGPTIIYCQSPSKASKVAKYLARNAELPETRVTAAATDWIAENYHVDWAVCEALRHGIGVHHGGVPRALQQYFIRLFNNRNIRFLVCTSTIIEGVNTVAKNVIIYDRRKSKNVLDHFTYKNIQGRAGRMREYFIGRVFVLESAPAEESFSVDFPIGIQGPDTPLGLLLDLENDDLTTNSRDRLRDLFNNSTLSPQTLRANRHAPIDAQERIAATIRDNLDHYVNVLRWTGVPTGPELDAVCNLIFDELETDLLRDYGVHSGDSLAWHLNALRIERDLSRYVKMAVEDRQDGKASDAVDEALRFIRNVVCHRFPRDLMVVNAIQAEIFEALSFPAGDYSLFAEQAENLFMPSVLFALDEYGVPIQTAQALAERLLPANTLDGVLEKLRRLVLEDVGLSPFELDVLSEVRQSIWAGR